MLLPKLRVLDKEAFPFNDRPRQMAAVRQHLKDREWLLVSGLADVLISAQRINRKARLREFMLRKRRDANIRKRCVCSVCALCVLCVCSVCALCVLCVCSVCVLCVCPV